MPFSTGQSASSTITSDGDWLTTRRFAALLALLVLASYPQVILGAQTFIYRDFGIFSYPNAYYFRESFWRGEIPLWNPLNNCGTPFLAQWNMQVLYPPALFYLLLPLSWSLGVFCLLHLFLGGMGMFVLAQRWTQNRLAAAFAGIVFAFSGLMLSSLTWPATIAALGWMPWAVWLTERAWREGGRQIVIAALAGALQMLSGGTEVVLLTWGLLGVLGLMEFVRGGFPRTKIAFRFCSVVVLISGLSAAQLLPFFDLLDYSRKQEVISASMWPMPMTGWANFFVPLFHCHSHQGVFMQINQSWINSYYVGAATVILALIAPWREWHGRALLLKIIVLFSLVLAVGETTPVYSWLSRHVGVVNLMRFPVKFVILPVFILPLLAAGALSRTSSAANGKFRWCHWAWLAVIGLTLGIVAWEWVSESSTGDRKLVVFNGLMRAGFLVVLAALWFFANKMTAQLSRRLCQVLLLLLVWLDLFRQMPLPPTIARAIYQPGLPRQWSAPRPGQSRALLPSGLRENFYHSFLTNVTADYIGRRFALNGNCNLLDGIPTCDGFFPLYLSDYALLYYNFYDAQGPTGPLLDFLGVKQVLVYQNNHYDWVPQTTFQPLLTAGQKPVFTNDLATLQMLTNADFNPRTAVCLPPDAKPLIAASNAVAAQLSSVDYSAQKIEARVEAPAPTMIVAAQIYYHPWRAYVDGKPTRLWPANYAFQAFEVPSGVHRIKLVYEDRQFHRGAIVSSATLFACLILWSVSSRRHGKESDTKNSS